MPEWRRALLKRIGAPVTQQNLTFLATWQRWEGGHTNNSATYNWLNTTQGEGRKVNSVGVKAFDSFDAGIKNIASTLNNGYYVDILDALASGNPYKAKPTRGLETWVAGPNGSNPKYAANVLGLPVEETKAPRGGHRPVTERPTKPSRATRVKKEPGMSASTVKMIFGGDPFWQDYFDRSAEADPVPGNDLVKLPGKAEDPAGLADVVKFASSQLGKPYVFGSGADTSSFDCSDLVQWAYKQIGISIPRVTQDQVNAGREVGPKEKLKPGDLIFPHAGHVVMYVGNGKVIAAPYTGTVVQYQDVPKRWRVRRIL